ncbi:hypothetical protein KJ652_02705 [Patescibacteria group bacterium]|nr:hypothetical protein [Patescibacteria group bacterium]MBU1123477.1 hypothetical protein [Patescibacteria group bacterium]MBU1910800.1 hypothetical protein [Patescibacteria group bacterium]
MIIDNDIAEYWPAAGEELRKQRFGSRPDLLYGNQKIKAECEHKCRKARGAGNANVSVLRWDSARQCGVCIGKHSCEKADDCDVLGP